MGGSPILTERAVGTMAGKPLGTLLGLNWLTVRGTSAKATKKTVWFKQLLARQGR